MKRPVVITLLIVALVLVCTGMGTVIFFGLDRGFPGNLFFFEPNSVSATATESKDYALEGVTSLQVQSDAGNVRVTGGDVDKVTIEAQKTAWGSNDADANATLKTLKYTVKKQGDALVVEYELNQNQVAKNRVDTIDFVIKVPQQLQVDVKVQFGEIELSGTEGDASLDSSFGDITVENVKGALKVTTQSGKVTTKSINAASQEISLQSGFGNLVLEKISSGNLKVESESGALTLDDVRASSDLELFTKFGEVSFEKGSAGKLTITTESGKVQLTSLQIAETLKVIDRFGNITLDQVDAKSYDLDTNSGAIEVDGVSSSIKAHSGFGNIFIQNGNDATIDLDTESGTVSYKGTLGEGPHKLHSDFGEIKVIIPADTAVNIDLKTEFGKIRSDLPITITVTGDVQSNHFVGTINGGGSELTATTQSGGISLEILSE